VFTACTRAHGRVHVYAVRTQAVVFTTRTLELSMVLDQIADMMSSSVLSLDLDQTLVHALV